MKVTIITPTYNSSKTIEHCLRSIHSQTYPHIEHIIIDGGSMDGTVDIIRKYEDKIACWISEKDNGIYDAINKGIRRATGEAIGILHSDDFYADSYVIEGVVKQLKEKKTDSCYGDLVYVDRNDTSKIVRYWRAGGFKKERFKFGWMPPHPTFFCKREIYEKYGLLNLDFPLASDYELMLRFLYKYGVSTTYISKVLVKMRTGGTSKPGNYTLGAIRENYRAWKVNNLYYPPTMLLKPFLKLIQYTYFPLRKCPLRRWN